MRPVHPSVLILMALARLSWAGETQATHSPSPLAPIGILQMLGGLILVLALVIGIAWALRRLAAHPQSAADAVRIIGGAMVGPRERVVLVEIGGTWLLIGVAPGRVTTLHSMPRTEKARDAASVSQPPGGFGAWVAQLSGRRSNDTR